MKLYWLSTDSSTRTLGGLAGRPGRMPSSALSGTVQAAARNLSTALVTGSEVSALQPE